MTIPDQTDDPVAALHRRLAAQRTMLMALLKRLAITGMAFANTEILFDIAKARADIAQMKMALRDLGVEPGDHPDDAE